MTLTETDEKRLVLLESDSKAIYKLLGEQAMRIDMIRHRLDDHGMRLDGIDGRLDAIDGRLALHNARFDAVDARLEEILELLHSRN